MTQRPVLIFGVTCAAAAVFLAGYLFHAGNRRPQNPPAPVADTRAPAAATASAASTVPAASPSASGAASAPSIAPRQRDSSRIFFRHTGVDSHYGMLAYTDSAAPTQVKFVDSLLCEVVHASGGRGLCLTADRGVFTTYAAILFDADTFAVRATLPLKGIPSRGRMSVDGKLAALTVFVTGHGYTSLDFSTQTLLIDVEHGTVLADLEDFAVQRGGQPFKNADFNFWGVTFTADAGSFYATLSTGGQHFLVRGGVAAHTAEVIHENVECPSLSPDAQHVAYKKRFNIDGRIVWQLHVLDLHSGSETALSEKRSVDDQLEWLGDNQVLYSVPSEDGSGASTDVWIAPADASAPPALLLRNAYSPATERKQEARVSRASPQG